MLKRHGTKSEKIISENSAWIVKDLYELEHVIPFIENRCFWLLIKKDHKWAKKQASNTNPTFSSIHAENTWLEVIGTYHV